MSGRNQPIYLVQVARYALLTSVPFMICNKLKIGKVILNDQWLIALKIEICLCTTTVSKNGK